MSTTDTTVVRARQKGVTGYKAIGRPNLFQNPYRIGDPHPETGLPMTLADVLSLFETYLLHRLETDASFRAAFVALEGETLGCPCPGAGCDPAKGEACHGHVIVRVLRAMRAEAEVKPEPITVHIPRRDAEAFVKAPKEFHEAFATMVQLVYDAASRGEI